jgi:hypothetical protein
VILRLNKVGAVRDCTTLWKRPLLEDPLVVENQRVIEVIRDSRAVC